jgi:Uma2 family endonuclease
MVCRINLPWKYFANFIQNMDMAKIVTSEYTLDLVAPQLEGMTDDEFFTFCLQNKHLKIERDEKHQILFMPPEGLEISAKNGSIFFELAVWNKQKGLGIAFGNSAGFYLPDTSMKSPDAAWLSNEKWNSLDNEERNKFGHVTPEFVVELMSPSDNQRDAKAKMQKWIENGVLLGWLIDPKKKEVYIYREDGTINKLEGFAHQLSGETVLPGFLFDLSVLA